MLKENNSSQIMLHEKKDKIVLLVHAYQTTPLVFGNLSMRLHNAGYSVYNIRLGGHGTKKEDRILDYGWEDWIKQVENIYLDMKSMFKEVYAVGLCLGAVVLLEIACTHGNFPKMVVYSPPLQLQFKPKYLLQFPLSLLFGVKKVPNKQWNLPEPQDPILENFTSFFPVQRGMQLRKFLKHLSKRVGTVQADILCFLSRQDKVISFEENHRFIKNNTNFSIITLEKSGHFIPLDIETEFVFNKTLEWLQK